MSGVGADVGTGLGAGVGAAVGALAMSQIPWFVYVDGKVPHSGPTPTRYRWMYVGAASFVAHEADE